MAPAGARMRRMPPKKPPRRTAERILEVTLTLFNRFGVSDVSPWLSLAVVASAFAAAALLALRLLASGYKLRQ